MKKLLIAAALAASLGAGVAVPSFADVVVVRTAPPPPRHEAVPEARRGYTWVAGHWDWNGRRNVWIKGKWVRDRNGYVYRPTVWEERDGRWVVERGGWHRGQRDRDGDGVPNRADRDRDGDGVPNRYDDRPNNPNRH
ncbi:hypothetical protein ASC94_11540 [Massilia sp. Root418]|uniref:YXWGXW repeat-containing protein n=1 Tax=Massilia sp. Root418 TaxID=1736532 RepID=UPI0006FC707F|nr:YXWGXW repeat-containing protein [Massilia sp. Root418]KQW93281.1 hypothetical protein ASC94_11540 [Massilia sp. Root418]